MKAGFAVLHVISITIVIMNDGLLCVDCKKSC